MPFWKQIASFKSRLNFERVELFREANKRSQKLFPFVKKWQKSIEVYPFIYTEFLSSYLDKFIFLLGDSSVNKIILAVWQSVLTEVI